MDDNYDFLSRIIESNEEYWIVSKTNYVKGVDGFSRDKDSIIFIRVPQEIKRGVGRKKVLFEDLKTLKNTEVTHNIFLNEDYPAFQSSIKFTDMYEGFPVTWPKENKQLLIELLQLDSDNLHDYRRCIKKYKEKSRGYDDLSCQQATAS